MSATLGVPEPRRESVEAFLKAEAIPLDLVVDGDCVVRVVESDERRPGTSSDLYPGGWITCTLGRGLGAKLGIGSGNMGKLLNHLDIKIRECELGCFG